MGNIVKFNSGVKSANSIKSGTFDIGVNSTPTNLTGFYTGISPINGGYTIYIDKASGGPSIYAPKDDATLINIVKTLGASVSTATDALVWINSQSNMTVVNNNYPSIVTDGLVLNLDAGFVSSYPKTGTTWRDLSGNGNNGTLVNGVGFSGGSMVFDGVDDVITSSAGNNYPYPYHTFEIWVKSSGLAPGMVQGGLLGLDYGRVVTITSTGNIQYSLYTGVGANQGLLFSVSTTGVNVFDNNWHHIVCSRGESVYEMYVDGVLNKTGGNGGQSTWNGLNTWSSMTSVIGNNPNNSNRKLLGNISSVRIYNRQLTLQEVLQNYRAGLQRYIPTNGLVLSLDAQNTNLYATSPTTAYDVSGNGNNGTLTNGVQYVADGDGSWSFDGINDYVSTAITTFGNNTTWTVWINRVSSVNTLNMFMGRFLPYFAAREGTNGFLFSNSINSVQKSVYSIGVTVKDNTWYHLSFTTEYNGVDTTMKMYINGVLNNSGTFTGEQTQFGYAFSIGDGRNLPWYPFNGEVNDVRIYNRTLTQAEITTIYNATKSRYGIQ